MRELAAGTNHGDPVANRLRDYLGHVIDQATNLSHATTASEAIKKLLGAGTTTLEHLTDALRKDPNLAPKLKAIAKAIAKVAGDVPVRLVAELGEPGELSGEFRPDIREIHIASDAAKGSAAVLLDRPAWHGCHDVATRDVKTWHVLEFVLLDFFLNDVPARPGRWFIFLHVGLCFVKVGKPGHFLNPW
jgi:hypothetical protein